MSYTPEKMAQVRSWLYEIDDSVPVTLTPGVRLPDVRTVGDLRALPAWPKGYRLVVKRHPFIKVRVELELP